MSKWMFRDLLGSENLTQWADNLLFSDVRCVVVKGFAYRPIIQLDVAVTDPVTEATEPIVFALRLRYSIPTWEELVTCKF